MNCYLEGIKQKALLNYTVDKWKFVEVRGTKSEGRIYRERSEPNLRALQGAIK